MRSRATAFQTRGREWCLPRYYFVFMYSRLVTADSKTIGPLGTHYAQSGHRRLLSGTKTYSHSEGRWRKIGGVGVRGRALRMRHGVADGSRQCPLCMPKGPIVLESAVISYY